MASLSQLVAALGGETTGRTSTDVDIRDVHVDSRRAAEGVLFAALPGTQTDGARFAADALDAGAPAVLSPLRLDELLAARPSWTNWIHPEARTVVGRAAALVHGEPAQELVTVGITGTNGKTTVAHLTAQLLEREGRRPGVVGTVAIHPWGRPARPATHTTPDAPELQRLCREQLDAGGDSLVLEVSSHALDQERLAGLELDVAVFTNLSAEHLDYHSDMDSYAAAKARIFAHVRPGGTAIVNADDAFAPRMVRAAREARIGVVTFGTRTPSDLGATELRADPDGINLTLEGMGIPRTGYRLPLVGRHNVQNALASLCVVLTLGASPSRAPEGLASLSAPPGRLEPVDVGQRGFRVFVDYAHTPDALQNVLEALRQTMQGEAEARGRLLCVFGCGGERDAEKRAPMGRVVGRSSDVAYVTSDNPRGEDPGEIIRDVLAGMTDARADVVVHSDRRVAIRAALKEARPGDLVLVAGKGHEAWQYLRNEKRAFDDKRVVLEELPVNPLKLQEVLDATGAVLLRGDAKRIVVGVSTDSRTLESGELFFALSGPNFDGNRFAALALDAGAAALVLRAEGPEDLDPELLGRAQGWAQAGAAGEADERGGAAILIHPDPRRALADLAGWYRSTLPATIVAISGSSGKTSTKDILHELLTESQAVVSSPRSFNNDIGVPLTLLMGSRTTETLALEMGTNNPGEIAALCRIAKPDAGIITNIGAAHLEGLGSLDGVAREKGDLAASIPRDGFLVLNADCRFTPTIAARSAARVITFSIEAAQGEEGDLDARDLYFHSGGTTFNLNGHEVTSPLLGTHNVQNLLAALAACVGLGLTLEQVLPRVAHLHGSRQRMERLVLDGVTVFDDSYNANPDAARAAVRVLAGVHGHARRVLVLGDMLELGELAAELHHEVGREAAEFGIDQIVLVGELARAAAAGALEGGLAPDAVTHVPTTEDALDAVEALVREGDVVLIKGSRRMRLERVVQHLQQVRRKG